MRSKSSQILSYMRFVVLFIFMLTASALVSARAEFSIAEIPNVHLSACTLYVSDPGGI